VSIHHKIRVKIAMYKYSIEVKGRHHRWSFPIDIDPKYLDDYRGDGLIIDEVVNVIPERLPRWLVDPWCAVQDLWRWIVQR
jgi:hypothetical protein